MGERKCRTIADADSWRRRQDQGIQNGIHRFLESRRRRRRMMMTNILSETNEIFMLCVCG